LIDSAPDGATINLPACTFTESLVVTNKNLSIVGTSAWTTVLQAPAGQRVLLFNGDKTLTLQHLVITGGHPSAAVGGGVSVPDGDLNVIHCRITQNSADYGGGIYQGNKGHTLNIINSTIDQNTSTWHGGGVFAKGDTHLTNTTFNDNTAGMHGGGLMNWEANTIIDGGSFARNHATTGNGGAVNVNNDLDVDAAQFTDNTSNELGGAITQWNPGYGIQISSSSFQGNTTKSKGGAVFINSSLSLDHDTFTGNIVNSGGNADAYGGAIYAGNSGNITAVPALLVSNSTFTANQVNCTGCIYLEGGGIFFGKTNQVLPLPSAIVSFSSFTGNHAWWGAGIYGGYSQLAVDHSTFTNNTAGYGAGIDAYILDGEALTFTGNQAVNGGGGVDSYDVTLRQSRFLDNACGNSGGCAVYAGNSANLVNILATQKLASTSSMIQLAGNGNSNLNNITVARPVKGGGTGIALESNATAHIFNTLLVNFTQGLDIYGKLTYDHLLFFNNTTNLIAQTGSVITDNGSNLQQDPLFVNPSAGDYHLQPASPAIAGGLFTAGVTIDLDGFPRTAGRSAMGAYNYLNKVYLPVITR
jgi:hypothetical protein